MFAGINMVMIKDNNIIGMISREAEEVVFIKEIQLEEGQRV